MKFNFETRSLTLQEGRRIYFASDFHLGVPTVEKSRDRERLIVKWLESIEHDAQIIFLVGDVFDFWFEYGHVVPKGFVRLLGKLAELSDRGIELILFTGNHDMWMFGYLKEEIGATIYRNPVNFNITLGTGITKSILIGHGDGLGPGDKVYKVLKHIFENRFFQSLFRFVHPGIGMSIASAWSKRSRIANVNKGEEKFMGEDKEWLLIYCKEVEKSRHHDYYVFGHRHLVLDLAVNEHSRYINLGEWVSRQTRHAYAEYDGNLLTLKNLS
jgi:UDP-2,3-diacylglucosamine hydrolase